MKIETDKFGRVVPINCYGNEHLVKKGNIVIANMSEFSLTNGKVYVVQDAGAYVEVINDDGDGKQYSYEYFDIYQGQKLEDY